MNSISYHKLDYLLGECNFEILWIMTRPRVLPRPTCVLIVPVVYCPPWYNACTNNALCEYILKSVDLLNRSYIHYPNGVFLITVDFNQLNTGLFNKLACFKQIFTSPTRGSNVLYKIFTN